MNYRLRLREGSDLTMYLEDFEAEIRRIDALVFATRMRSSIRVCVTRELPEGSGHGVRAGVVSSYFPKLLLSCGDSIMPLHDGEECHIIWIAGVGKSLRSAFVDGGGDRWLRRLWFQSACMLARARILNHPSWFPVAQLRTVQSIRKHVALFGPSFFREHPRLPLIASSPERTEKELDLCLTQTLIDAGLQQGMSEFEALHLLTEP